VWEGVDVALKEAQCSTREMSQSEGREGEIAYQLLPSKEKKKIPYATAAVQKKIITIFLCNFPRRACPIFVTHFRLLHMLSFSHLG
jgi:hypothetical protein